MAVEIKDFAVAVADILDGYTEDVREAVADAVEQAGKKALKTVKAKSPKSKGRGGGRYKKGWRMKKERRLGVYHDVARMTIYNATDGPLVHLLENGHQKANGERVEGIPHVQPAYEEAERVLPQLTAKAIEGAMKQ